MSTEHLQEVHHIRQVPGEPPRRWFYSEWMDLTVWTKPRQGFIGFQLAYRAPGHSEHALTWLKGRGFDHARVDTESGSAYSGTPLLVANGVVNLALLLARFEKASQTLPIEVRSYVDSALRAYPKPPSSAGKRTHKPRRKKGVRK